MFNPEPLGLTKIGGLEALHTITREKHLLRSYGCVQLDLVKVKTPLFIYTVMLSASRFGSENLSGHGIS